MSYIDREKIDDKIFKSAWWNDRDLDVMYDLVEDAPEEDVAPVVHAHWDMSWEEVGAFETTRTIYKAHCSNCGRREDITLMGLHDTHNINIYNLIKEKFPYCHCGARMDE